MWLDRAVRWLLPREDRFYDLLGRGADCARRSGELLASCCGEPSRSGREAILGRMRDVEHEADRVIAEVNEALNRTFVTPIDRSDIHALATALEDLTDQLFATALQFDVHAIEEPPAGACELTAMIGQACEALDEAVGHLRSPGSFDAIRELCRRVNRLESEGDRVYRTRLGEMFRHEADAIRLLKNKEFLEGLERALDLCDDAGNALESIVIKNA